VGAFVVAVAGAGASAAEQIWSKAMPRTTPNVILDTILIVPFYLYTLINSQSFTRVSVKVQKERAKILLPAGVFLLESAR
jgi:hypothetical protein